MNQKMIACCLFVVFSSSSTYAENVAESFVTDKRVKTYTYSENQVYRLVAYYGYQTDVQLSSDEELKTISAGDSAGFQITPADGGRHIFIKPMAHGARTNLSVITSKRIYVFDLSARAVEDPDAITYFVRFQYPQNSWMKGPRAQMAKAPGELHFDYKVSGDRDIQPERVFDDGQFTYFQFADEKDLPAIYLVGGDGKESIINYRMEDGYVVIERTGDFYTLRSGKQTATVINQAHVMKGKA